MKLPDRYMRAYYTILFTFICINFYIKQWLLLPLKDASLIEDN